MSGAGGLIRQFGLVTSTRWRMWLNTVRAHPSVALLAGVGLLAFVVPVALTVGVGTYAAYGALGSPLRDHLMVLVLAGVFVVWAFFPVYSTTMQRTLDTRPLRLLPVSGFRVAALVSVSSLLDATTLGVLPAYLPVLAAYARWKQVWWLAVVLVVLTWCAATLAALVALLLHRVGGGRRRLWWVLPLLGLAPFLLFYYALARGGWFRPERFEPTGILALPWAAWLRWTPPGWAAGSIRAALDGRVGEAGTYLAALVAACVGLVWLYGVLGGSVAGEGTRGRGARKERVHPAGRAGFRWPEGPVWAVARKEMRCLFRDPQVRVAMLTTPLAVLPVFIVAWVFAWDGQRIVMAGMAVPLAAVVGGSVFFNTFGMEREGLAATLLQPTDRRTVLLGKNLGDTAAVIAVMAPVVVLAGVVGGSWRFALGGLFVLGMAVPPVLGVGNYWAVEFPFRAPKRGENPFEPGLLSMWVIAFLHMVGVLVAGLLALPAMVLTAVALTLVGPAWGVLCVLSAMGYSGYLYWVLLRGAARRLMASEPEVLAAVTGRTRRWGG